MKKWAFVSDFDGTISDQDFYDLVIEKYFPNGRQLYERWRAQELLDIEFLQTVFSSIDQDEAKIIEDIFSMQIDTYVPNFIKTVQKNHGDFFILSAGTDYYIRHILNKYHIQNVKILSNKGHFHKKNIHLNIDETHPHYSKRYGIDKAKVLQHLRNEYEMIYFIGDSEPDSHPAKYADISFAKRALQDILQEMKVPFVPVQTFKEVEVYLVNKGVLNEC